MAARRGICGRSPLSLTFPVTGLCGRLLCHLSDCKLKPASHELLFSVSYPVTKNLEVNILSPYLPLQIIIYLKFKHVMRVLCG